MATTRSEALIQAITELKLSLRATSANPKAVRAQETVPGARVKKEPCCKFCGRAGHLIEACKEVDKYVLAGKCKRNTSGRIVLPSGVDIPPRANCKTLQDRCDRQNIGLQVAMTGPHRNNTANQQRPAPAPARHASPRASVSTIWGPAAMLPIANKVPVRPYYTGSQQLAQQVGICSAPVLVPAPASPAQQCMLQRLPDRAKAITPGLQRVYRTRRLVQNRRRALSAGWQPEHYRWQYRQPMACAMYVHAPATSTQDGNHHRHLPMRLQVPRQHA